MSEMNYLEYKNLIESKKPGRYLLNADIKNPILDRRTRYGIKSIVFEKGAIVNVPALRLEKCAYSMKMKNIF